MKKNFNQSQAIPLSEDAFIAGLSEALSYINDVPVYKEATAFRPFSKSFPGSIGTQSYKIKVPDFRNVIKEINKNIESICLTAKMPLRAGSRSAAQWMHYSVGGCLRGGFTVDTLFADMAVFAFKKYKKVSIAQQHIRSIVRCLLRELRSRSVKFKYIVPIGQCFRLPEETTKLHLTKDICLRYLTPEESMHINREVESSHRGAEGSIIAFVGSAELSVGFNELANDNQGLFSEESEKAKLVREIWENINIALSAFLLQKDWWFEIEAIYFLTVEELIIDLNFSQEKNGALKTSGSYAFVEGDLEEIGANIKRLHKFRAETFINNALTKLTEAAFRYKPEESIVDAVIGCETILLYQQGDREMKNFKMALNYSVLDDSIDGNRKMERFKQFNEIISFRNGLVHGNVTSVKEAKKHAATSKEVLRQCIKSMLTLLEKSEHKKKDQEFWKDFYLKRIYQVT